MSEAERGSASGSASGKVARSLSWTLLGELGFAAGQWLALVVLAKLASPEALGRYSLGLAVATPIMLLCSLHLRPVWVVDVEGRVRFEHAMALRLLGVPATLLLTAAVVLIRGWSLEVAAVVMMIAVVRAAGSISDICYARAQRAERMRSIGISRLSQGVLWVAALAIGLWLGGELLAVGLVAAVMLIHVVAFDLPAARRHGEVRPKFEGPALLRLLRYALPMGLAGALLGVSSSVPAYVLEAKADLAAVGFFAVALTILQASGVLNMAMGNAAIPRLARLAADDARGFWRLLVRVLGLLALLNGLGVALVYLFGEAYLRSAFTPEYAQYLPELMVASVAALVLGLTNMLSQTLTSLSQFRLQLWLNLIALGFSCVAAWLLIDEWGLRGAIWSLVALAGFRLVLCLVAVIWVGPRARS
jgi:O-antigen/teichoic acid export membrane protein